MTREERIELELWRFRAIDDHDDALNQVFSTIETIKDLFKKVNR